MTFEQKVDKASEKNNSLLCLGLDPDLEKLPKHLLKQKNPLFEFNKKIIDVTYNLVCVYKPNIAFYEALGIEGLEQLKLTIEYIQKNYPQTPILLDAKRGDIGNTAEKYAQSVFDYWKVDAVTVNPYQGFDSIEAYLKYKDKGIIVLCRTSNPGAADFQDLKVNGEPLYISVAKKIIQWNKKCKNCLLFMGATWPQQIKKVRKLAPYMLFLVAGVGAQKGELENAITSGLRKDKKGLMINVSRSILYAGDGEDFMIQARNEAQAYKDAINSFR